MQEKRCADPKEPPEPEPEPEPGPDDEHGAALAETLREIEEEQPKEGA